MFGQLLSYSRSPPIAFIFYVFFHLHVKSPFVAWIWNNVGKFGFDMLKLLKVCSISWPTQFNQLK